MESFNNTLGMIICFIFLIWGLLYIPILIITRKICANILFNCNKYIKFTDIYDFIYQQKYEHNNLRFMIKIKVHINTYIEKMKYIKNSSLDNIVTIMITALMTMTVASYNLQASSNKNLIDGIRKGMSNDFLTVILIISFIYSIRMVLRGIANIELDYYLLVKNIIDEIEKKEKDEEKIEYRKKIISRLEEMKVILKENKKETSIVEKIINKFF